jgi:hypothetical protein
MLQRAGYIEKSGDCMSIRIPSLGSFSVTLQEITAVINRGRTAPLVATSFQISSSVQHSWCEAGTITRSRSGRALMFNVGRSRFMVPVQGVSLVLANRKRYASLAALHRP